MEYALHDALSKGYSGQNLVDYLASQGINGVQYYPENQIYGLPNSYAAPDSSGNYALTWRSGTPNTPYNPNGTGSSSFGSSPNANVMADTLGVRAQLAALFGGQNLGSGGNQYGIDAANIAGGLGTRAADTSFGMGNIGMNSIMDLFNQVGGSTSGTSDLITQLLGRGGTQSGDASSAIMQLLGLSGQTGTDQVNKSLSDIATAGQVGINQDQANIKEQFGQMGLGQSSDIAQALATGSAQGRANIAQTQSSMIAQLLPQLLSQRTGAAGSAGNLALQSQQQTTSGLSPLLSTLLSSQTAPAGIQTNLLGLIPNIMQGITGGQVGGGQLNLGAGQLQNQISNELNPYLSAALGFGTSYPGAPPVVQSNTGSSLIGGAASVLSAILPFLIMSHSSLKEDIVPVDTGKVRSTLDKLPIFTWKYKGSNTKHIGPMAEQFRDLFGVGDGITLNPVDLFGVMLSTVKEMSANA
jgi:hypothetical protein